MKRGSTYRPPNRGRALDAEVPDTMGAGLDAAIVSEDGEDKGDIGSIGDVKLALGLEV